MSLTTAHVYPRVGGINIAYLEIQCFAEPKSHTIGGEDKRLVSHFPGCIDHCRDLFRRHDVRQGFDDGWFDDVDPDPFFAKDVFVEELQAIAVNLHGTPGV